MRIKGQISKPKKSSIKYIPYAVLGILVLVLLLGYSNRIGGEEYYFCDMERSVDNGKRIKSNGYEFVNGETQSEEKAFKGKFSARLDNQSLYGPMVRLQNVNSGDVIEASIWRQSDDGFGTLVLQGEGGFDFYVEVKHASKRSNGWDLLKDTITIPIGIENQALKIYPTYQRGYDGAVYFDDMEVRRRKSGFTEAIPESEFQGQALNLQVDILGLEEMKKKRLEALAEGVLTVGRRDLVKAKLKIEEQDLNVQTRLKGDLPDHLMGKKWSFRVVVDEPENWQGMTEFSVHNAKSRFFLHEWLFHQLLEKEGVMTTRYDFVQMSLNDNVLGIYAYEEHFRNALLRHQERPVAPIICWSEEGLWQNVPKNFENPPAWFESAHIQPYESKKVLNDNEQYAYFQRAQNLLNALANNEQKAAAVFDTTALAKYLALVDISISFHALGHTNMRFYFHPVTGKLEPIGYDGYTPDGTRFNKLPMMNGAKINSRVSKYFYPNPGAGNNGFIHYPVFNDLDFSETYIRYLEKYSDPVWIDSLRVQYQKELDNRAEFIKKEYTTFQFDWKDFFRNAKEIRKVLYPLPQISVKAWKQANGSILLESYHSLPLEIVGFGNKGIEYKPKERLILESFNSDIPVKQYDIPLRSKFKNVFCKTLGTNKVMAFSIFEWNAPSEIPAIQVSNLAAIEALDFIQILNDKTVLIQKGKHTIKEDLILPESYQLKMSGGTVLNLENGASIQVQGDLQLLGTEENPVVIHSADKSGKGILVMNAIETSHLSHVIIDNLSANNTGGKFTQSALTFYKSDAQLKHCRFTNITAKEAISLHHANYLVENCHFENTAADAFDANYSTGKIKETVFENIGKDAVEISGGFVQIGSFWANAVSGAALNLNHRAKAEAWAIDVKNGEQGLVIADESDLILFNLNLEAIQQGILVYQKLPEFGGGVAEIKDYTEKEVKSLHLVDGKSILKLKGKQIKEH